MASSSEADSKHESLEIENETNECSESKTSTDPSPEEDNVTEQKPADSDIAEVDEGASSSCKEGEEADGGSGDTNIPPTEKEMVDFKVVYNKQKYDVTFALDDTVENLKSHMNTLTGVPVSMQKVMFKGRMRDEASLREHKVMKGSKIMLVGSTVNDVMSVAAPDPKTLKEEEKKAAAASKEPLSTQKPHKTVLEKHGKPEDAMPGRKTGKEPLPPQPVSGMYNKSGGKVRLTFKLEVDQLWIGTKERTEKIPMGSIKAVVSEPLDGHEEYHMLGIQLGPTEASRYWIYWVPAQYVDAIKDAVLGKWQFF